MRRGYIIIIWVELLTIYYVFVGSLFSSSWQIRVCLLTDDDHTISSCMKTKADTPNRHKVDTEIPCIIIVIQAVSNMQISSQRYLNKVASNIFILHNNVKHEIYQFHLHAHYIENYIILMRILNCIYRVITKSYTL